MKIKSLDIDILKNTIISDIDDCIFFTSKSLEELNIKKTEFWYLDHIFDKYKDEVFNNAQLTEWGKEFKEMVINGFEDYILITSSPNRTEILKKKLFIDEKKIIQGISDIDKVYFLNEFTKNAIYIDDKLFVIKQIENKKIQSINYPKKIPKKFRKF